jgi:hypothetical protein
MFEIIKRMIESKRYTNVYIEERIDIFYMVNKLSKEEYLELKRMIEKC